LSGITSPILETGDAIEKGQENAVRRTVAVLGDLQFGLALQLLSVVLIGGVVGRPPEKCYNVLPQAVGSILWQSAG